MDLDQGQNNLPKDALHLTPLPATLLGGKGASLLKLQSIKSSDFKIPAHVVMDLETSLVVEQVVSDTDALSTINFSKKSKPELPEELLSFVDQALAELGRGPVIVRSNSLREGGELSFSGVYESVRVDKANRVEVAEAILSV